MNNFSINRNAHILLLSLALLSLVWLAPSASGQGRIDADQEKIDKRVDEIMERALNQGVFTTPEGVRVTPMGANVSSEAMQEIQTFGDRAIIPLGKYLDSPNPRAQTLATKLLGAIGGTNTIKPLTYAAEKCTSSIARTVALLNLGAARGGNIAFISPCSVTVWPTDVGARIDPEVFPCVEGPSFGPWFSGHLGKVYCGNR